MEWKSFRITRSVPTLVPALGESSPNQLVKVLDEVVSKNIISNMDKDHIPVCQSQ